MGGSSSLSSYIQNRSTTVSGRGRSSIQTPDKSCGESDAAAFGGADCCLVCAAAATEKLNTIAMASAIPSGCFPISKLPPETNSFLVSDLRIIHCGSCIASRPIQIAQHPIKERLPCHCPFPVD